MDTYITTYTGRKFWPLNPRAEDVNLIDICHALSNMCRFTGHVIEFYSVAEHSCRVHDILPPEHRLAGLLHDAPEYVLSDLAKPTKSQPEMTEFCDAEDRLMDIIAQKYGFEFPFHESIKEADSILFYTERRDLMPLSDMTLNGYKPLPARITPWRPVEAKYAMMDRLKKLGLEVTK
jgi:hypothetical protein